MFEILVIVAVFVCVASLVGAVAYIFRGNDNSDVENRLTALTKNRGRGAKVEEKKSPLIASMDAVPGLFESLVSRFLNLSKFIEQSGVDITPNKLIMISAGLGIWNQLYLPVAFSFKSTCHLRIFHFCLTASRLGLV